MSIKTGDKNLKRSLFTQHIKKNIRQQEHAHNLRQKSGAI